MATTRERFGWRGRIALALALLALSMSAGGHDAVAQGGGPAVAGFGFGRAPDSPGGYTLMLAAYHWPDGTVEGRYEVEERGIRYRGDISCLTVNGDTAYVSGLIHEVNGQLVEFEGLFIFAVVDGGASGPQRLGRLFDPFGQAPYARVACAQQPALLVPAQPLVRGAFVVRP